MYEPTDIDLAWLAEVLQTTNEGAIIVFPSSGMIYKVSHIHHTLTLQNPAVLAKADCRRLHEMTTVVAAFFMYAVKEAVQ